MKCVLVLCFLTAVFTTMTWAAPGKNKDNCFDCICTTHYDPVCGNNDETYANKCNLACAQGCNPKIKLAYKGQCGTKKELQQEPTTENSAMEEEVTTSRDSIVEENHDAQDEDTVVLPDTTVAPEMSDDNEESLEEATTTKQ